MISISNAVGHHKVLLRSEKINEGKSFCFVLFFVLVFSGAFVCVWLGSLPP